MKIVPEFLLRHDLRLFVFVSTPTIDIDRKIKSRILELLRLKIPADSHDNFLKLYKKCALFENCPKSKKALPNCFLTDLNGSKTLLNGSASMKTKNSC